MGSHGMLDTAKVIVAIDFGTTFSGFSYAHVQSGEKDLQNFLDTVEGYDRWPAQDKAGAKPYYKTQTSLLYVQKGALGNLEYELKGWGWSASVEHAKLLKKAGKSKRVDGKLFHFITKFKLALAGKNAYGDSYTLPRGLAAERVISDYLHGLSEVVEKELQDKYGPHVKKKDVQWCLTVPAMWDESAKHQMKKCAEVAGLVAGPSNAHGGGSPHPIIIVLEPEAASAYCLYYLKKSHQTTLGLKSKILIVDAGGGTVDLVLHEKSDRDQVQEICGGSSGALCGSTFVDDEFYKLLSRKVSSYDKFVSEHPSAVFRIRQMWEDFKFGFDGELGPEFWLPAQLSKYWEEDRKAKGLHQPESSYDEVEISLEEITAVFDSAVNTILDLIDRQLSQVGDNDVDALLVVGGFSNSPYLMYRIKTKFESKVKRIVNPTHSGKAVVTGAVAYGCLGKDIVTARVSRKTYGVGKTNHATSSGAPLLFRIYARKGDAVKVDQCIEVEFTPQDWVRNEKNFVAITVFSSTDTHPLLVTDAGSMQECTFTFPYPGTLEKPIFVISMFFGRTSIEVSAVGRNFNSQKVLAPSMTFES